MAIKKTKKACLITGMHRSGTSAVTCLISQMGAEIGSTVMPPQPDNPKGFWENKRVFELNERMLHAIGLRWDLPDVDQAKLPTAFLKEHFELEAVALLAYEYGDSEFIAIKDPRFTILLDFWVDILEAQEFEVFCVMIYRHPREVSASLEARNGFTQRHSDLLWVDSVREILAVQRIDVCLLEWDAFFKDPHSSAKVVADYLELDTKLLNNVVDGYRANHLDVKLRHFHSDGEWAVTPAIDIYAALKENGGALIAPQKLLKTLLEFVDVQLPERVLYRERLRIYITAIASAGGQIVIPGSAIDGRASLNILLLNALELHSGSVSNELVMEGQIGAVETKVSQEIKVNRDIQSEVGALNVSIEQLKTKLDIERKSSEKLQRSLKGEGQQKAELLKRLKDVELAAKESEEKVQALLVVESNRVNSALEQNALLRQQITDSEDAAREKLRELQAILSTEQEGRVWLEEKRNEQKAIISSQALSINGLLQTMPKVLRELQRVLNLVQSTSRWRLGNKLVNLLNLLRFKNEKFGQLNVAKSLIAKTIAELQSFGKAQLGVPDLDGTHILKADVKESFAENARLELNDFMEKNHKIVFPSHKAFELSIILVTYNRAELTLRCLKSLHAIEGVKFEILLVDNDSQDSTRELLERIEGLDVTFNGQNDGFLLACNQALEKVRAPAVLYLNNDCEVIGESVQAALKTLNSDDLVGAVGAKIVQLNGQLQEAGSIVWSDASCAGYGRGESPDDYRYLFRRDVDYCSGAFLMTRTDLLKQLGGFDQSYAPAYYEEVDYCFELAQRGLRVVYDPNVVISHYEFGSSEGNSYSSDLMVKNKEKFLRKWGGRLEKSFDPQFAHHALARTNIDQQGLRILYIDDRVPHGYFGSGFPRSNFILNSLADAGNLITMFPLNFPFEESLEGLYSDIDDRIEIAFGLGRERFDEFWHERSDFYDLIWVSRPHNLEFLTAIVNAPDRQHRLVYDAEAIFADREQSRKKLGLEGDNQKSHSALLKEELSLIKGVDALVAVSPRDANIFRQHLPKTTQVIAMGHGLEIQNTQENLDTREDLLFVGNLDRDETPNVDSLLWFNEFVWPAIKKAYPKLRVHVVGSNQAQSLSQINDVDILFHGRVDDIGDYYSNAKIFIAPTRFSAGIPIKVQEAASYGLPCVATEILVEQLAWEADVDILSAEVNDHDTFAEQCIRLLSNDELWLNVRASSLSRVAEECSSDRMDEKLAELVNEVVKEQ